MWRACPSAERDVPERELRVLPILPREESGAHRYTGPCSSTTFEPPHSSRVTTRWTHSNFSAFAFRLTKRIQVVEVWLKVYHIPTDPELTGAQIEQMYLDLVRDVKRSIRIPVAVKLSPYFSAVPNMAKRLDQAGADALVLFNRLYQPV